MGNIFDLPDNANASYLLWYRDKVCRNYRYSHHCQQFNVDFALPVFAISKYLNSSVFGCFRFVETL